MTATTFTYVPAGPEAVGHRYQDAYLRWLLSSIPLAIKSRFTRSLETYPVPPQHRFCIDFCERSPTEWLLARPHLQAVSDRLNRKTSVFTTTLGSVGSQPIKHGVTMRSTSFVKFSNHELFGPVIPIPQPR